MKAGLKTTKTIGNLPLVALSEYLTQGVIDLEILDVVMYVDSDYRRSTCDL